MKRPWSGCYQPPAKLRIPPECAPRLRGELLRRRLGWRWRHGLRVGRPYASSCDVYLRWIRQDDCMFEPCPLGSGTLSLQSNDPNIQPSLNYRYLETETDRQRLGEAVRISAALGDQAAFHSLIEARVSPSDEDLGSDQALEEWMLNEVVTSHHSSGTCKMGPLTDPTAVVDQYGRVYGTNGLRVADASIMPDCIRGNTNATVMAIGERIADFVKEGR